MSTRAYGCIPDRKDFRDHHLMASIQPSKLPKMMDLQPNMPPVWDQENLGCCTGFGVGAVYAYDVLRQKLPYKDPSQLFIYYNERSIENTINSDAGAQIRDGIKAIHDYGCSSEELWPYIPSKFTEKPPQQAYDYAAQHKTVLYARVPQNLTMLQSTIASGYPIVFGMTVYESFESDEVAHTGMVPFPETTESDVGGHCMVLCGYRNDWRTFKVRNSWGTSWGLGGYCHIPFEYILNPNLTSDLWVVKVVQ